MPHNNLKSLFDFVCQEISDSTFYFNRKSKEELDKHLRSIEKADLVSTWSQISQKSLDIQVLAKSHESEFNKHENRHEYQEFKEIKEGEYHEDVISSRRNNFL